MAAYEFGVIGGGNMAEAVLRGLIRADFIPPEAIVVADPLESRCQHLAQKLGVACQADNLVPAACPRLMLAVKPQVMAGVLAEIAGVVQSGATVISIAAGITAAFIDKRLGGRGHIVRVMPNTPMLVGAGVSAIASGPRAAGADLQWTQDLFAASGSTCIVDESLMDAVTAVSGSGPAYFFYLIEAMIAAGVTEGLDANVAAELAIGTCAGAAKLLMETREKPEVLRAGVTSPGGTTQRAIETLDDANVRQAVIRAVRAAAARSRELGK